MPDRQLLTVIQLSQLIHKSPASIRSDTIRNPKSLPPVLKIPNSRRILFYGYEEWLNSLCEDHSHNQNTISSDVKPVIGPGRPTKAAELQRRFNDKNSISPKGDK